MAEMNWVGKSSLILRCDVKEERGAGSQMYPITQFQTLKAAEEKGQNVLRTQESFRKLRMVERKQ